MTMSIFISRSMTKTALMSSVSCPGSVWRISIRLVGEAICRMTSQPLMEPREAHDKSFSASWVFPTSRTRPRSEGCRRRAQVRAALVATRTATVIGMLSSSARGRNPRMCHWLLEKKR